FGLAMPGLVDLAMFGEDRSDVAYWADMREPTLIEPIGVSVSTTLSWTVGHVMMSVGAPLALLYTLAPRHRGRPMLGRIGIPLTAAAAALVALAVHRDRQAAYGYSLSAGQAGGRRCCGGAGRPARRSSRRRLLTVGRPGGCRARRRRRDRCTGRHPTGRPGARRRDGARGADCSGRDSRRPAQSLDRPHAGHMDGC